MIESEFGILNFFLNLGIASDILNWNFLKFQEKFQIFLNNGFWTSSKAVSFNTIIEGWIWNASLN